MKEKSYFKIGILLVIICLVMLTMFNIFCNNNRLNSDSSSELVLGKILSEEGAVISPEWCYSTELRILNFQLVTTPLFLLTDNWHTVRAVSNSVFYILLLLSYVFLATGMKLQKGHFVFTSALLLLPLSLDAVDIIHIGGFYIPHIIVLFVTLGLFLRADKKICFAGFIALSFIAGLSGIRYLLTIQIPLAGAAIYLYHKSDTKKIIGAFSGLVACGAGFICNHFLHKIFSFYDESSVAFYSQGTPVERLGLIADGLLRIFGFRKGAPIHSAEGIVSALALVLTAAVIYLAVCKIKDFKTNNNNFILVFFMASFLLNTFIFTVGSEQVYAPRYYFPALITLIPLIAQELSGEKTRQLAVICAVVFAVLIGGYTLYEASSYDRNDNRYASIEFLTENGYDLGYATFWNANITTELSDGKIRMANIDENFEPYMWLTPKKYYDGRVKPQKPFLLLTAEEYEKFKDKIIDCKAVYADDSFVVLDIVR